MSDALMIQCPACGTVNRVPQAKLAQGQRPVCGNCKAALPLSAGPITVTDQSFLNDVERSSLPVLLDLWAPWCPPCRMVAPIVEELATEMAGRVQVAKMNVDENPDTSRRFQVQSIPTLLVLKAGKEIDRMVGAQPKSEIVKRLERAMASGDCSTGR